MKTLDFIVNGIETRRYHTWPVLRQQNVGEHSARVALILMWLSDRAGLVISNQLLMSALIHDLAEHVVGDIPSPTKREIPGLRDSWQAIEDKLLKQHGLEFTLSPREQRWLKLADSTDGALYCIRERAMGNRLIMEVYNNFRSYIEEIVDAEDEAEADLLNYIDRKWREANV